MDDRLLATELTHSIFWMCVTRDSAYRHRKEINALEYAPTLDITNKSSFTIESDQGDPDLSEIFLRNFSASKLCTVGDTDYEHRAIVKLCFVASSLRNALLNTDISPFVDKSMAIEVFLEEAARFDCHFESMKDGRPALASLPITMDWFTAPQYFIAVINALVDAGYCECTQKQFRWLQQIKPHMESAQLWVANKTIHQIRDAELAYIWDTMPRRLKAPFIDHAEKINALDVLSFAAVMGHFWYDDQWHEEPKDLDSLKRGDLCGGRISTAKELGRLFKEGKIRF